ncbi:MAG: hypothetical protein RLZZ612_1403 [Pseudomonadota bacterium]|jgi:predicted ABC-type ATPase
MNTSTLDTDAQARQPRVVVFAGPNGAGKSTHAEAILATLGIDVFVNADHIARGLSGRNTEAVAFEAGRIMLRRLRQLSASREDFAFETTLSSRTFAHFLSILKKQGYGVAIYYFSLATPQLAVRRVKLRVSLGGHHVPPDVVKRRFERSLHNFFELYVPLASHWAVFDNSLPPYARLLAYCNNGSLTIQEPNTWHKLQKTLKASLVTPPSTPQPC